MDNAGDDENVISVEPYPKNKGQGKQIKKKGLQNTRKCVQIGEESWIREEEP